LAEAVGLVTEEKVMHADTKSYNKAQAPTEREICELLAEQINLQLPEAENKVWHAHPVWFLDGNPVVGYSKLKGCVRLLFWSGQSFTKDWLKKAPSRPRKRATRRLGRSTRRS
jgi:hypothetical protein